MSEQQIVVGFVVFIFFLCLVGMFGGMAAFLLGIRHELKKEADGDPNERC